MRCVPLLLASLMTLPAMAAPAQTGPLALPSSEEGAALPGAGVRAGRVGGLPTVFVEVRTDGISVDGEPVLILQDGALRKSQIRKDEDVLLPVYERVAGKVGGRRAYGIEPPILGVFAVDGRVQARALGRVMESARFAGVDRVLFLVEDRVARDSWLPTPLPDGAAQLREARFGVVIDVSDQGFEVIETEALLTENELSKLTCRKTCTQVDELPWSALDKALGTLVERSEQPPMVRVMTRQEGLPSAALVTAVGLAASHFDVVNVDVVEGTAGGELSVADDTAAEPLSLSGKLVGVSATLESLGEGQGIAGLPAYKIQKSLDKLKGRTRACLAQGGAGLSISVRLEIDEDGLVSAATVLSSSVDAPAPGRCLLNVVREAKFDKPIGVTPFVTTWTFDSDT